MLRSSWVTTTLQLGDDLRIMEKCSVGCCQRAVYVYVEVADGGRRLLRIVLKLAARFDYTDIVVGERRSAG